MKEQINFTLKGLSGEAKYNLEPLTRKESLRIFHTVSELLISGLGNIIQGLTKKGDFDEKALLDISKSFDFDKVYLIGSSVFRAATITDASGLHTIDNLEDSDYFDDKPLDFYLAIAYAIRGNWPKVFFELTRKLRDFGDSEGVQKMLQNLSQKFQKTD
jgi:hypothetical protein